MGRVLALAGGPGPGGRVLALAEGCSSVVALARGGLGSAGVGSLLSCPNCASPWPRSTPSSATSRATPDDRRADPGGGRGRRAPGRVPRDGAHRLPGRGPRAAPVLPAGLDRALDALAATLADEGLGGIAAIVGYLDLRDGGGDNPLGTPRGAPMNAAAVLHGGQVVARYTKHHLPNYGVFDEFRYFVPGTDPCVVRIARRRRRPRDLRGPLAGRRPGRPGARGPGRPCSWSSTGRRTSCTRTTSASRCASRRARRGRGALAYVNMVGGQDELVFDGDSLVVGPDGQLSRAPRSSPRRCSWSTSTSRPPAGTAPPRSPAGRRALRAAAPPGRSSRGSPTRPRCTPR